LVDVVRYVVAQEVGKAINPAAVLGQVQGGVVQGLGYALSESLRLVDGRMVERSLEAYRLPLAVDVPDVEAILMEHPDAAGPYGAKGVAEPSIIPVAAAVANAVSDAIGVALTEIPVTPEAIVEALERRDLEGGGR
jgi:CO/xanthine dehydrogenase Mo-binding subunit